MTPPATLTALLDDSARDDRHVTFVEGDGEQRSLSFRRLRQRALGVLGTLQRRGLRRGDHAVVCLADNERFVEVFWGCVLGGIVPAPLAAGGTPEQAKKLLRVFEQLDAAIVLTDPRTLERLDSPAAGGADAAVVARLRERAYVGIAADGAGTPGRPHDAAPDELAFIQYSSGSTGQPKGVLLTHRNLAANIESIIEAAAFSDRDVALSWMPLSHDMGLIGFHMNMLACGASHAIMRTELFARRPLLWLELASRLRATVLCSPNFGYRHVLRQLPGRAPPRLDLSSVRLIFNGAEPIAPALARSFVETMAAHGLPATAMYPVYGLAEASLAVTFPRPGRPFETVAFERASLAVGNAVRTAAAPDAGAVELAKLGWPVPGSDVRVVGDDGQPLAASHLGSVEVRGANVSRGYYGEPAAAADRWLNTGDLGALLDDGQLVVAGRAKDVVFVNGQNVYPYDVEQVAEAVGGIEPTRVAAAGVPRDDGEVLGLFVVHRGPIADFAPIAAALVRGINRQMGLEVGLVVPVARIPKTTSGKVRRYALAEACAGGEYDAALAELAALAPAAQPAAAAAAAAAASTLQKLQAICRIVVPQQQLAPETDLMEINLSSLDLARIHEAIEREFPQRVDVTDLFDHPTLAGLADFIDRQAA